MKKFVVVGATIGALALNSRLVIPNLFRDLMCFSIYKGFALLLLVILGKILKQVQDDEL